MQIFAGGFLLALGATLMGILFGYIYWKTKSLVITIIAHMCANLPDFIFYGRSEFGQITRMISVIFFMIVLVGGIFIIHKQRKIV